VAEAKFEGVLGKFLAWNKPTTLDHNFPSMSMAQWAATRLGQAYGAYAAAAAGDTADTHGTAKGVLRAAAHDLAVARGLLPPRVPAQRDAVGRICLVDGQTRMSGAGGVLGLDLTSGPDGNTALIRAVASGNLDDVMVLLDAGASIDATDNKGYCALASCIIYGYDRIARELLRRGASLDVVTVRRESIVCLAGRFGRLAVLEAIRDTCGDEKFKVLLQLKTSFGLSSLHIAVQENRLSVVRMMANAGGLDLLLTTPQTGVSCLNFAAQKVRALVNISCMRAPRVLPRARQNVHACARTHMHTP